MEYLVRRYSIAKKVLNDKTGELEHKEFKEEVARKRIKGGFCMVYHKNYEEIMELVVNSNKEMKLFNWITNQFTYQKIEVPLSYSDIDFISKPQFTKMIKQLIQAGYLYRVKRGIYRLNPFIFIPYKANGEELQKEWNEITNK